MPYKGSSGGALEPYKVVTGEITWQVVVPYAIARRIVTRCVKQVESAEEGSKVDIDFGTMADIVVRQCVKSWEGVVDENDNPVAWAPERITEDNLLDWGVLVELAANVANLLFDREKKGVVSPPS
jgi:hypothetical protein